MKPLYQLVEQYRALESLGEEEELDPQALADTLEGLAGELEVKATNVAAHVLNIEAYATAIEEAAKAMGARAKRVRRRADAMRAYLLTNLLAAGREKIDSAQFTIAVRKNPPAVLIEEGAKIPRRFMRKPPPPPVVPDKAAIAEALKAGKVIPGCRLDSARRLEIKP